MSLSITRRFVRKEVCIQVKEPCRWIVGVVLAVGFGDGSLNVDRGPFPNVANAKLAMFTSSWSRAEQYKAELSDRSTILRLSTCWARRCWEILDICGRCIPLFACCSALLSVLERRHAMIGVVVVGIICECWRLLFCILKWKCVDRRQWHQMNVASKSCCGVRVRWTRRTSGGRINLSESDSQHNSYSYWLT